MNEYNHSHCWNDNHPMGNTTWADNGVPCTHEAAIDSHVAKDTRIMYLLYLEQAMHNGGYSMTKAEIDELENYRAEGGAL